MHGTVNPQIAKQYPFQNSTIPETKQLSFIQQALQYDAIIFDLDSCNLSNTEYLIKGIKNSNIEKDITLIGISNIQTWANTTAKYLQPGEEEEPIEDEFMKEAEEETPPEN